MMRKDRGKALTKMGREDALALADALILGGGSYIHIHNLPHGSYVLAALLVQALTPLTLAVCIPSDTAPTSRYVLSLSL
jgi:hypothetical protein